MSDSKRPEKQESRTTSNGPVNGPPDHPEEITLPELIEVWWRRKRLGASVVAIIFVGAVMMTGMTSATYEASATLLPVNERDEVFAVMESRAFAASVADELGLSNRLGSEERAVLDLQKRVDVVKGTNRVGDQDETIVTITAQADSPQGASATANAYLSSLEEWGEYFKEITWGKRWEAYYQDAGKDVEVAERELSALVDNMTYWQPLDQAVPPGGAISPDWSLNLALGGAMAMVMGAIAPFLAEGVSNAWTELKRNRRGPKRFQQGVGAE